ncbi:MAG: hypothetical protein CSA79_00535 [Thiothrix nivea]|nr:MAG: hypothetical protein CSA79_00535 [Thiothrix nivea]
MAYLNKPKYLISQAADIITTETGINHTHQDILDLAKDGTIQLCIYRPEERYVQHGGGYHREYCQITEESILIPNGGGSLFYDGKIIAGKADEYFPVLSQANAEKIANGNKEVMQSALEIPLRNNEGTEITVCRVWVNSAPLSGDKYHQFINWAEQWGIKQYPESINGLMDIESWKDWHYLTLGGGIEQHLMIKADEVVLSQWALEQYIGSLQGERETVTAPVPSYVPECNDAPLKVSEYIHKKPIEKAVFSCKSSNGNNNTEAMLEVAMSHKHRHGYYPAKNKLFDLIVKAGDGYGKREKEAFGKAYKRYFEEVGNKNCPTHRDR